MLKLLTLKARVSRSWFLVAGVLANVLYRGGRAWLGWSGTLDWRRIGEQPPALIAYDLAWTGIFMLLCTARLHDMNRSGWWAWGLLVLLFAPSIGGQVTLGLASMSLYWLVLLFWPGTVGPNRYGPDPRGWKSREHYQEQQRELAAQTRR